MDRITVKNFPKVNNEYVSFENPHGWTEEQIIECMNKIRQNTNTAYNIQYMALASRMKKGKYDG